MLRSSQCRDGFLNHALRLGDDGLVLRRKVRQRGAHTAQMLRAAGELVSAYCEESRRERRPIENLREALGRQALETIRPYTIENMVKAHVEIFSDGRK